MSPPPEMLNFLWVRIALAYIAILFGSRIPVPGIDAAALAEQISYSPMQAMARFSIFALGAFPLFTVLAYMEIAKLIVPSLVKWQASSAGSSGMSLIVKILVLGLTAIQGYGIIRALTSMGIVDGSAGVLVAGIASFIGASAVLIWLADRLPGMATGVWLLLTIPMLGALPHGVGTLVELMHSSATFWNR